jgi:hypothetical protein
MVSDASLGEEEPGKCNSLDDADLVDRLNGRKTALYRVKYPKPESLTLDL